jgi:hypothetical protein
MLLTWTNDMIWLSRRGLTNSSPKLASSQSPAVRNVPPKAFSRTKKMPVVKVIKPFSSASML